MKLGATRAVAITVSIEECVEAATRAFGVILQGVKRDRLRNACGVLVCEREQIVGVCGVGTFN